jgi:hypothetical protein
MSCEPSSPKKSVVNGDKRRFRGEKKRRSNENVGNERESSVNGRENRKKMRRNRSLITTSCYFRTQTLTHVRNYIIQPSQRLGRTSERPTQAKKTTGKKNQLRRNQKKIDNQK